MHILVEKDYEGQNYTQFLNKVSCLGKIVPGIAHEINNPWHTCRDGCRYSLLKHKILTPKKTYETLIREFERIANLANSLLEFTKQTPRSKKSLI